MKRKTQKRKVNKIHEQVKALEAVATELPTDVEIVARLLQNKKGKKSKPGKAPQSYAVTWDESVSPSIWN